MPEWKIEGESAEAAGWRLTIVDGQATLTSCGADAWSRDDPRDPYESVMSARDLREFAALLNEGADRLEGEPSAEERRSHALIITEDQPVGTIVRDRDEDLWKRDERGWLFGSSAGIEWDPNSEGWPRVQVYAPITLVSRP